MKILYSYIKKYKGILFLALILAAINQSFSLCDSIITGKLLNKLGVNLKDYNNDKFWFMKDLAFFLSLSVGAAMLSRLAKTFRIILQILLFRELELKCILMELKKL